MSTDLDEETHYRLLSLIQDNPDISQRQLAEEMGVSVGKVNYCIKALVKIGHLKLENFKRSKRKLGYAYLLTPKAIAEKTKITIKFLELKKQQYDVIKQEIASLQKEISTTENINR